jgi:hypothetical protein
MLDLRTPLGWLFSVGGLLRAAYGVAARPVAGATMTGWTAPFNVDLWWGAAMAVFGVALLVARRRGQAR